jgi:hypothetical protein
MRTRIFLLLLLSIPHGIVFFWLVVVRIFARIGARLGHASPCPASFTGLVNNPLRQRTMRPVFDCISVQAGETVLELGPGPGLFTIETARRAGC